VDKKIDEIIMLYAKQVNERYNPKAIYLYGSQVKGTANQYSDIDIAVVVEPMDVESYMQMFGKLFSIAADYEANIEPNLLEDDGEYDRFSFLAEVMETGRLIEV
jgi:predicted nucleotidyltransferase